VTTDNSGFQPKYTQAEKQELLASYNTAMNLTPEEKAFTQKLTEFYKDQFKRANEAGIVQNAFEAFHAHAWAEDRTKSQDIEPKQWRDDYGTLSMPPSDEVKRLLSSMTEEEIFNFKDLLGRLQAGHESRRRVSPLHFHPEARAVLWGTALAKLADHFHEIGRKERALFFTEAAWKLSMYPLFAYNAALLASEAGDARQARSWFLIYLAEYQDALRNPVLKLVTEDDPEVTASRFEAFAKSARARLATMQSQ